MSVLVNLALATICFTSNGVEKCANVLIGKTTPRGEFVLQQRLTDDPGYGGDVLQFDEDEKSVLAVHRVWLLNPKQNRLQRLSSPDPKDRVITNGCINVDPIIYQEIVDCCSNLSLTVK